MVSTCLRFEVQIKTTKEVLMLLFHRQKTRKMNIFHCVDNLTFLWRSHLGLELCRFNLTERAGCFIVLKTRVHNGVKLFLLFG